MKENIIDKNLNALFARYKNLESIRSEIVKALLILIECYEKDSKLLIAGNGGSASDSEHMVAELMKRFKLERSIDEELSKKMCAIDTERGKILSRNLEKGLMAISLTSNDALSSAYLNDVDGISCFAQKLYGFGRKGDVFFAISTSGNSENIIRAAIVANALGIKVIGLSGKNGGELEKFTDVMIKVPEFETYVIQELHQPIYHCICLVLEEYFFSQNK